VVEIYREITERDQKILAREENYVIRGVIEQVKHAPWFQNAPDACHRFGSCEHLDACTSGKAEVFPIRRALSPSIIKTWRVCPELARHALRDRGEVDHSETYEGPERMVSGTAFHAAIAEVYRRAWEEKRNG
jgi:hypothetical protein